MNFWAFLSLLPFLLVKEYITFHAGKNCIYLQNYCQSWRNFNPFIFHFSESLLIAFKEEILFMATLQFILFLPFQLILFTYHFATSTASLPVACIYKAQLPLLSEEVYFSLMSRPICKGGWRSRSQFLKK